MDLLHLSDIHIHSLDQAKLWSTQLAEDLKELKCSSVGALIISGDVGNFSTRDEYRAASELIRRISSEFKIEKNRVVLVPGNHDLSYRLSAESYTRVPKKSAVDPRKLISIGRRFWERDHTKHRQRFRSFGAFYKRTIGTSYPLNYEKQFVLQFFPEVNLLVLGLNSEWQVDHLFEKKAGINSLALSNALSEVRINSQYLNATKIAVWHHPVNSEGEDRISSTGPLEQLAKAGFICILHGHIHKADLQAFYYDRTIDGRKLHLIAAGTFGAPTKQLVSTYPWGYNFVRITEESMTVHTRARHLEDGPWRADAIWFNKSNRPLPETVVRFRRKRRNRVDWGDAPTSERFYGRKRELSKYKRWVTEERSRLIAITGIGGIGKTQLVRKLTEDLRSRFEYVIWKSLQNAMGIDELIDGLTRQLTHQTISTVPSDLNGKIQMLLDYLTKHRCLIILDNLETIFQASLPVGHYRDGFEGYGLLLEKLGVLRHRSCVILTTRELPPEISKFTASSRDIRTDELTGVPVTVAKQVLAEYRIEGTSSDWKELVERFSGNLIFLRIAADSIKGGRFQNQIRRFLDERQTPKSPSSLFHTLFSRLTLVEQSIIFWMAIIRESTNADDLSKLITDKIEISLIFDALSSLKGRSFIQSRANRFALENVISEYATEHFCDRIVACLVAKEIDFLDAHPVMIANAGEEVKETQRVLILSPIANRLAKKYNSQEVRAVLESCLAELHAQNNTSLTGYGAATLIHLFGFLDLSLAGLSFSGLRLREALLQSVKLQRTNFLGSKFERCLFLDTFGGVLSIAISINSELIASGDASGQLRVWRISGWELIATIKAHNDWVRAVKFSPNGETIYSCSDDKTIKAWGVNTQQCLMIFQGHSSRIRAIDVSSNGRFLVSGSDDGQVKWWNTEDGLCFHTTQAHSAHLRATSLSPDGNTLATAAEDSTIKLWDIASKLLLKTLEAHEQGAYSIVFSKDSKLLISGGEDGYARVWEVDSGRCLEAFKGHDRFVWAVAISPDGSTIATGSGDHTIKLWSLLSSSCIGTLVGHTNWLRSLSFISNDFLVSAGDDRTIRIWDWKRAVCVTTLLGHMDWIYSLALSPDGKYVAFGNEDRLVTIWPISGQHSQEPLKGHTDWIWSLAFTPDSNLLASSSGDQTIRIWNVRQNSWIRTLVGHNGQVRAVTFSADGRLLASGSDDRTIKVWDVTDGRQVLSTEESLDQIWALQFSPDNSMLASGDDAGSVRLWRVADGKSVKTLGKHDSRVLSVAFSECGNLLASTGEDSSIVVWDLQSGERVMTLLGHRTFVQSISFSRDGSLVGSGSKDDLRTWKLDTQECQKIVPIPTDRQRSIIPMGSDNFWACGSTGGTIQVWDLFADRSLGELKSELPYDGMVITGSSGLSTAQRQSLVKLGAID